MSAIAGFVCLDGRSAEPGLLARMVERLAHRGPDGRNVWCQGSVALGHLALWTTPEEVGERQPRIDLDADLALAADARIDNRSELLSLLAQPGPRAQISDAELMLAAYRKWGADCAARLIGDFAFALWDGRRGRLLLARDHVGQRSLYYHHTGDIFAFATEIKALLAIPGLSREIDGRRVAEYLLSEPGDRERTFFRDVRRLPAAHRLAVGPGSPTMRRYWALDSRRTVPLRSDGEYEEAFRELLTEAVRCRLRSKSPAGSTLSGGLDSSALVCSAREILRPGGAPLHTFSAVFPDLPEAELRRIDERRFVDAVVAGGGLIPHQVRADRLGPLDDLESVLRSQDEPHVPINLYLHRGLYRAARDHGVMVLLDGFDGDTTLSHGLFRLTELVVSLRWASLLREARALAQRSPNPEYTLGRVLRGYAFEPLVPKAIRRALRGITAKSAERERASILAPGILRPRAGRPAAAWSWSRRGRWIHQAALDSPMIQSVLELADKATAACGVEARYPFFDRRLMEFCLALPADQKLREGWTRSILRRSMTGILPAEVQWRPHKADLSPNFLRQLRANCAETVDPLLADGGAELARFVDLEALAKLYRRFLAGPSPADGLRLFCAATLGVWLRQRRSSGG